MRNRGKSRQSEGSNWGQITKNSDGGAELDWKGCNPKQIHLKGNGQVHAILQGIEKCFSMD